MNQDAKSAESAQVHMNKREFLSQLLCSLFTLRIVERTKFTTIIERNRKDSLRKDAKRAMECR